MITIRQATQDDAAWMQKEFDTRMGWTKPAGYFSQCCAEQANDLITLFVAADGANYCGHLKVVWTPDYPGFRDNGIPEIQDLNVLPDYRRKGIASKMMDAAEALIVTRTSVVGIGVGLYDSYGPAQRMYVLRGYVPDGKGIVYDNVYVQPGEPYPVDDELILHFTRKLS